MLWIALDGTNAVGKTTQAGILYDRFSKNVRVGYILLILTL
jgi:thymidylate kinase